MPHSSSKHSPSNAGWGNPPWTIDFKSTARALPSEVDFAIVGGGFSGLSAAARLRQVQPDKTTVVFEADCVGAGSSGYTGGMALAESAAGDLPGLGDVLEGLAQIQRELKIECDLSLPGVWELGRKNIKKDSPISWNDSGTLGVVNDAPGGTIDPGKLVSGLAQAAQESGALIFEHARVEKISFEQPLELEVSGKRVRAGQVLIATNAESLELSDLSGEAEPKFTLALATAPLTDAQLKEVGLSTRKPFYTVDMPYLWGRPLHGNQVIFGSGLVHLEHWSELFNLNISSGEAAGLMRLLESRVHSLHPALENVQFTNRWGGPILIADGMAPVFKHHLKSKNVIVLGGYSGHGVALSVYLGRWAADVLAGKRKLPSWNKSSGAKH
ncbi:MAG TPA: FAD-dependent oxidoreductase [Candidatus Dormibacteraeota bacterium]|nr:FAD-dependent oxidoreductase [Candidatus Dormibacteraeota bacterium]